MTKTVLPQQSMTTLTFGLLFWGLVFNFWQDVLVKQLLKEIENNRLSEYK